MREVLENALPRFVSRARAIGRDVLLETEAYTLVEALGIETPAHVFLADAEDLAVLFKANKKQYFLEKGKNELKVLRFGSLYYQPQRSLTF